MKGYLISILAVLILGVMACKKNGSYATDVPTGGERKIRFQLYTDKDFSSDGSVINFSLVIRNAYRTLLDTPLAPMQIKDIPDAAHKLVFEKTVPGNYNLDLSAGFRYEIPGVGNSWYMDTSKAGNVLKIIDYDFR